MSWLSIQFYAFRLIKFAHLGLGWHTTPLKCIQSLANVHFGRSFIHWRTTDPVQNYAANHANPASNTMQRQLKFPIWPFWAYWWWPLAEERVCHEKINLMHVRLKSKPSDKWNAPFERLECSRLCIECILPNFFFFVSHSNRSQILENWSGTHFHVTFGFRFQLTTWN